MRDDNVAAGGAVPPLRGREPFAPGSISLRVYPHDDHDATQIVDEMRFQAQSAVAHGFAGVMTSEHHGGFAGYLPNPLQMAGWLLDAMPEGWAAACPLLLTLRPPALVVEEVAWLAARFPGRVGVGVAAGALADDFAIMGLGRRDLAARFAAGLAVVADALSGRDPGALGGDRAVAACANHPVPVLSAAMGFTAVRRAAAHGVGLIFDSLSTVTRVRELIDAYHTADGTQPCVLIRRAWVGQAPRTFVDRQVNVYRSYSPPAATTHWGDDELAVADEPGAVAERLRRALEDSGAHALNLRVHVPGVAPAEVREQIVRLGTEVIPLIAAGDGPAPPA